ncbi:MAG: LysM domain-containing protein [Isosphaeraceae bacterium]
MPRLYTVQRGDSLSTIAARHGFRDWRLIYNFEGNRLFRQRRPNPNLIFPGDVIAIPDTATPTAHPAAVPGPPVLITDGKCCSLARMDNECQHPAGDKGAYTCPPGYVRQFWTCLEGSRTIGCGECAKAPSTACWVGPFDCSIWWYI